MILKIFSTLNNSMIQLVQTAQRARMSLFAAVCLKLWQPDYPAGTEALAGGSWGKVHVRGKVQGRAMADSELTSVPVGTDTFLGGDWVLWLIFRAH